MKRIFIITQFFLPESVGRATRIHGLAKFLQKFHDVTVIAPPPSWPFTVHKKADYFFKSEKFEGVKVKRVWTYQPSKKNPTFFDLLKYYLFFQFFIIFYLIFHITKISTIIFSTPPSFVLLASPIVRLFRKKFIVDVGDLPVDLKLDSSSQIKDNYFNKKMRDFEINCWKKANLVISNSWVVRDKIKKILKDNCPSKVKYFPFNVDSQKFKKLDVTRKKQLVYIGSISAAQNLQAIVKTMPIILKKIPEIKLQIYGGGRDEPLLRTLINDLGLEQSCAIDSPISREQIPLILSKSTIGIVALAMNKSLDYAMPTKTWEYMACSLPVFAYGASEELARIIKESDSGKCVKSETPEEIADNLLSMLSNPADLEKFSRNGRNFVEKNTENSELSELI